MELSFLIFEILAYLSVYSFPFNFIDCDVLGYHYIFVPVSVYCLIKIYTTFINIYTYGMK